MSKISRPQVPCYFCSDLIPEGEPRYTEMLNFRLQFDPVSITAPGGESTIELPHNVFALVADEKNAHRECVERRAKNIKLSPLSDETFKDALTGRPSLLPLDAEIELISTQASNELSGEQIPGQLRAF